jgi:hypothetical protein
MLGKLKPEEAIVKVHSSLQPFTMNLRVKANTMSKNAYFTIKVRVCGEESLTTVGSTAT